MLDAEILDHAIDDAVICVDRAGIVFRWNRSAERIFGWSAKEICGQPFARLFTPQDRVHGVPEQELAIAQDAGRAPDNRWHLRKDGSRFFAMGFVTPLANGAGYCKVLRDGTAEHDTEQQLRASQQDVRTVADILPALIAYVDSEQVYRFANRTYESWFGVAPQRIVGKTLLQFLGSEHYARRERQVEQVLGGAEVQFDDTFVDREGHERHIAFQYIPRRREDGVVGGFYLLGHDITERATALAARTEELVLLARHLQTAQESERAHLARELHDELGAIFTTAKLDVARLKPVLPDTDDARSRVQHLVDNLNRGVQLKRRIIEDLKPSALEHFGLAVSLANLVDDFAAASQLEVKLDFAEASLSPSASLTVYRMVQEALTNVAKYANAKTVRIASHLEGTVFVVQIADDGAGFEPSQARPSAHGLRGMEFRVQAEGGTFAVHSEPGKGTVLTARVPVPVARSF